MVGNPHEKVARSATDDILDGIPYGVSILDVKGKHVRLNEAYLEMSGYEEDELIGLHVAKLASEGDAATVSAVLEECLETGATKSLEFTATTRQGENFPIAFTASPLENPLGEPAGFVVTVRNITKRRRLEAERLRRRMVGDASEIVAGNVVREFGVPVLAEEMGLPSLLQNLAELSIKPSPENLLNLMVIGIRKLLRKRGVEASEGKIRRILTPVVREFLRQTFVLADEYCMEIPREYREFKGKLAEGR